MDDAVKFVKNGMFVRDRAEHVSFYGYDEIYRISPIYKEGDFHKICVYFFKRERLTLEDKNTVKLTEIHNQILKGWINYHSQDLNLQIEKKLDALLNHIEIMPGGEEYEKAKNSSESIISFNS
jgi:hypothetical protein